VEERKIAENFLVKNTDQMNLYQNN